MKVLKYLQLLRVKHYIKNFIVFLPIFFAGKVFEQEYLLKGFMGMAIFCLASSVIYILNDLQDKTRDQMHPTKCKRPIASGRVSEREAVILLVILSLMACVLLAFANASLMAIIFVVVYVLINVLYSLGCKNIPIVDVVMLASGYPLRLLFGGCISGITVSPWLFLTIICVSSYMGIGKRYGELKQITEKNGDLQKIRPVLLKYDRSYLEKHLYLFLGLSIAFYSLWTIERAERLVYTVPFVLVLVMRYNWLLEKKDGDPVEMIFRDWPIIVIGISYMLVLVGVLYKL